MPQQDITIRINDVEFDAKVAYVVHPGEPAVTHLPPEQCHEGSPDEIELTHLFLFGADVSELLLNKQLYEAVANDLIDVLGS